MATYYFRNAGTNWGDAANWSLSDGGGADGAVPLATDNAYFTSNSGNCTVNASARVCSTLIFSGVGAGNYANTFTVDNNVTVSGNVTLSATMTVAGTADLRINALSTITSNGKTWTGGFTVATTGAAQIITLADNWTIDGTFTLSAAGSAATLNNNGTTKTFTINGGLNLASGPFLSGSANLILAGTGTWSSATSAIYLGNNLTINTAGTITLGTNVAYQTGTLTYTAGTVVTTGSTLFLNNTCTLATNGITWNNITHNNTASSSTYTLSNDLTCSGDFTSLNVNNGLGFNGSTFRVGGSFTSDLQAGIITGTTNIILNGSGTLATNSATTGGVQNNLTINTTGTIIIGTLFSYNTLTLTYTAGTVTTTSSRLLISGAATLATNGITWNNITFSSASNVTVTLSNNLTCSGNFNITQAAANFILNGNTFNIGGSFTSTYTTGTLSGTTTIVMNGTGTLSTNSATTGGIRNSLTINTSGTITLGTNFTYATGTLTYTAGTVVTAGNTLNIQGTSTLATNGMTWNNISYATTAAGTITLSNNLTCSGNFTTSNTTNNLTLTGSTLRIGGSLTSAVTSGVVGGTTNIILDGTGTLHTNSSTGGTSVSCGIISNLTINTTGTITVGTRFDYSVRTLTYTAGTVNAGGSLLNLRACTLATNGITWANIQIASVTITLSNNLTCSGNFNHFGGPANNAVLNGSTLNVGGSLLTNHTSGTLSGTTNIVMNGTGTIASTAGTTGGYRNNITINTSGTITIGTAVHYGTGTFRYTAGTVLSPSNSLFFVVANCTLDTDRGSTQILFNYLQITGSFTVTLSSNLNASGLALVSGTPAITVGSNQILATTLWLGDNAATTFTVPQTLQLTNLVIDRNSGNFNHVLNGSTINLGGAGGLYKYGNGTLSGTTNIVFNGNSFWTQVSGTGRVSNNVTINTTGYVYFGRNIIYGSGTLNYISGVIRNAEPTITFTITDSATLLNMHEIVFNRVVVTSGVTLTMNEFFSGSPSTPTTIAPSSTTNYTITFRDNFEKFSRFVKVSRATITRRGQLTVITDKGNNGNNVGVKFAPNQLANGIAKNNPSVINQPVFGTSGLVKDPTLA